ncbi:MAG: type II toxin-antitoxin system VapC family toxin [Proteobacteria bacterium]|nr:type II toxin-antitoxin system VapC family toxin [Pseudomonadota bacterium]
MRYWDTSALVPLLVQEAGSELAQAWLREDAQVVTWALSRVELAGAIERRARQQLISAAERRLLLARLDALCRGWDEVTAVLHVVPRAAQLLARHALRAADAVQLAAALIVSEGDPSSLEFVCLDRQLADAAEREGFVTLTWPSE